MVFLAGALGCDSRQISDADLDSTIMLVETKNGEPQEWISLRQWKNKMILHPNIDDVEERFSRDGKSLGMEFDVESKGERMVVMFEPREGKLYPSHFGSEGDVLRVKSNMGQMMVTIIVKSSVKE